MITATPKRFARCEREVLPSPEEIRRLTAEIRSGWTSEERAVRRKMARQNQHRLAGLLFRRSAA